MKSDIPIVLRWIPKLFNRPYQYAKDKWRVFSGYSTKKKIIIVGSLALVAMIIIPAASYLYFVRDINNRERLMNRNSTGIVITDRNNEAIYSYGRTANERFYTLDEISNHMEDALIASEDKNFYEHNGYSVRSIGAALIANVLNRDVSKYGGSTLTQQLVKNNLLSNDKNFLRKYQELSLAIAIERNYEKDEILEMYLNSVYFGEGAFGIERAAEIYFGKTPAELTLAESSMLVGLLPAPSLFSPISGDPELAKQEQQRVLAEMNEDGVIDENQMEKAYKQKLTYAEANTEEREYAQHFSQMIIAQLNERYGEEKVTRSGYRVKSTLDLEAQKQAEQAVKDHIASIESLGANNAAVVAIDPKSGDIKVYIGSYDWNNQDYGQVDMAQTYRQPGSSFKPIYYGEALDQKIITPSTILDDSPREFADGYRPENYDFQYRGDVTVRHALALSLNIPAIEVMEKLGIAESLEAAEKMGISIDESENYGLTLALGSGETKLLEMVNAYSGFANAGLQNEASSILSIEDKYGKVIYEKDSERTRTLSEEGAYLLSSILSDEVARAPLSGSSLNLFGRKVAVKTGTTSDNVDAWTIGYTPSLAVGVWAGDNSHQPMDIGGTAAAGPIWRGVMQQMLGNSPAEEFERPDDIVEQDFCGPNGSYYEVYIEGTEPENYCHIPTPAEIEAERKREEEEERRRQEQEEREEEEQSEEEQTEEDTTTEEGDTTEEGTVEDGTGSGDSTGSDGGTTEEDPTTEGSGSGSGEETTP